jgi:hypothetical protein
MDDYSSQRKTRQRRPRPAARPPPSRLSRLRTSLGIAYGICVWGIRAAVAYQPPRTLTGPHPAIYMPVCARRPTGD